MGTNLPAGLAPADLVATAREVAADLATRAERHDREGSYAPENIEAIWAAGLGNLLLPADLGGLGAGLLTASRVIETLAAGDPSTALIYLMHQLQVRNLSDPASGWPEHLRARIVAGSLAGPALINALRVEPELGTPARGGVPATTAQRVTTADGSPAWRLNGRKIYSTGSYGLRWMSVWGATAADDPDGQRVGFFVVPADSRGVKIVETWDHLGMRATVSHDVIFDDVVVPLADTANLTPTGAPGRVDAAQAAALGRMNVLLVSIYLGVAKAARD
jgi:alkylation response protein AidB-like acyl-CoA dehydrogenase